MICVVSFPNWRPWTCAVAYTKLKQTICPICTEYKSSTNIHIYYIYIAYISSCSAENLGHSMGQAFKAFDPIQLQVFCMPQVASENRPREQAQTHLPLGRVSWKLSIFLYLLFPLCLLLEKISCAGWQVNNPLRDIFLLQVNGLGNNKEQLIRLLVSWGGCGSECECIPQWKQNRTADEEFPDTVIRMYSPIFMYVCVDSLDLLVKAHCASHYL